ncbi:UxaA family hydrolase [Candidatus Bathyarchaeota archaeon]|nr:UxaA family hydrolase [Candidatus Bathyarchaeota archaeon]
MARRYIVVDGGDNVATAITDMKKGEEAEGGAVKLIQGIRYGHKFAIQGIGEGEYVVKYGENVGRATADIKPGEHVHIHNVEDIVDEVRKL